MPNKPDAIQIVARANRLKNLARTVLGSGSGRELLDELKHVYCDGKLYCDNDRDTIYFIAQRDLVLELEHNVNEMMNGEEVS